MLLTENRRRSDPRILYGILAESALEQFREQVRLDDDGRAYVRNLIRLLEMYRYNTLRRTSPRAVSDRHQTDTKTLKRDRTANEAVERALSTAHRAVYAGLEKDELVDHLKDLFNRVLRNEFVSISGDDLVRARRFLERLAAALRS